jgi:sulfite exporter TauE/SafE
VNADLTLLLAGGFGLGLLHSFDPDHLAAMSTLVGRHHRSTVADFFKGVIWGLGHTVSLLVFGAALVIIGARLSGGVEQMFEAGVGVLLIVLGLWRLHDARHGPHLHPHRHGGDKHAHVHLHPRGHAHEEPTAHAHHSHAPFWIGILHGLAGTGGVMVLLPVVVIHDVGHYFLYIAAFGLGSIASMGVFCAGLGGAMSALRARWDNAGRWLAGIAGTLSLGVGIFWFAAAVHF